MKPRYERGPGDTTIRTHFRKPTPEEQEKLRRWAEEADRRARERLKREYGDDV